MIQKIGIVTFTDAFVKAIGFCLVPIYLGFMSQGEFGEFSFIYNSVTSLILFFNLGLYVSMIRLATTANTYAQKKIIFSTIFNQSVVWIVTINLIIFIFQDFLLQQFYLIFHVKNFVKLKFWLFVITINFGVFTLQLYSFFIALQKTQFLVLFFLLKFFVPATLSIGLLYFEPFLLDTSSLRFIGIALGEFFILIIFYYFAIRQFFQIIISNNVLWDSLKIGLPLAPSALAAIFIVVIDRKLIADYYGLETVAVYNLAFILLLPLQVVMSATQAIFVPILIKTRNTENVGLVMDKARFYSFVILIISGIGASFLGMIMLKLELINKSYVEIPKVILYLTVGYTFGLLMQLNDGALLKYKLTWISSAMSMMTLFLNYSLNLFLIPKFGIIGAATALTFGNTSVFLIGYFIVKNVINKHRIA
jgi:O-antigen/teichoic acid export membrane protein